MPLMSRSGVRVPSPRRTATASSCPSTRTVRIPASEPAGIGRAVACDGIVASFLGDNGCYGRLLRCEDVGARRGGAGGVACAANLGGRGNALPGALAQPLAPAVPPGARALLRAGEPLGGIGRGLRIREVPRLPIARR